MFKLAKGIYSKLSQTILEERILHEGKRIVVSDVDGTIHDGALFGRYAGLTYIDLALHILPRLVFYPKQLCTFSSALGRIFLDELKERDEEKHITDFVSGLNGVPSGVVKSASVETASHISFQATIFLQKLLRKDAQLFLVSKTLQPMADAYVAKLQQAVGEKVFSSSNPLLIKDGRIIGLEKKVITAEQKAAYVKEKIEQEQPTQVIAFGDSKEDALFFRLGYPENSLRIAVNPKDDEIKEAADVWSWSWQELDHVLFHTPLPKKKWFFYGAMGLSAALYLQEPPYYHAVAKEAGKMTIDWVSSPPAKKAKTLLADFHVHVDAGTNAKEVVDFVPEDVDIMMLADKSWHDLSFQELKMKLLKEQIPFADKGYLLQLQRKGNPLWIGYAQETSLHGFHFLSIGHKRSILKDKNPYESAKQQQAIIIPAHPYTVHGQKMMWLFPYALRKEKTIMPFDKMDAIESFNSQNQLFWCLSNVHAQREIERTGFPGVAGSDTHGVLRDIGISGVIFPKEKINFSTDEEFYASIRKAIREKKFERREHYTSLWTTYSTVIHPSLHWYHYGIFLALFSTGYYLKRR